MSRHLKIVVACVVFLAFYGGIHFLARELAPINPVTPENVMDFNARFVLKILSNLYPPATFFALMWISRVRREHPTFSETDAAKIILNFGMVLLLFAQGPAFVVTGWLQGDLAVFFYTLYPIGWCYVLAGMFLLPAIRHTLLGSRLGIVSLVVSLVWYAGGSLRHEFSPYSIGWSIAAILSLLVALCGILSPKRSERNFAACGLILMSVYSIFGGRFGGAAWIQIGLVADPRLMEPFLLTGLLAWTALVVQVTGLSRSLGLEEQPRG